MNKTTTNEFVCVDCGTTVFSYPPLLRPRERCYNCSFIHRLELPSAKEQELRKMLGVERPIKVSPY